MLSVYTETVPSRGGVRPGNPTPAHAQGQGSPAPIRPQNPTPVHAGKEKTGRPGKITDHFMSRHGINRTLLYIYCN